VTWAGGIAFTQSGALKSWNNASGHYLPSGSFAENAARAHPDLPIAQFVPTHTGPVRQPAVPGGRPAHREGPQLPVFQPPTRPQGERPPKVAPGRPRLEELEAHLRRSKTKTPPKNLPTTTSPPGTGSKPPTPKFQIRLPEMKLRGVVRGGLTALLTIAAGKLIGDVTQNFVDSQVKDL
jgi:hypothetical protein